MDNIFDGVNDGVNDGGGNPTFNSKRTVSKEEQARILQAVKDTAQNNANREPINLKPVTIKAKKPLWANLEEKYTNEELAKLNANKNWGAPTKLGDVVQRRAATNAARDLIAQKYPNLEKDIEKNRVATLNKMLPKERELIERSDYASKIATTYGDDFRQGVTDFSELFTPAGWGDGNKRNYDPSKMTQEEANNSSSWDMLAPLSVPSKIVQSMYKPGYTMGDALSGKKNNADGFEDIATDLAAWTGIGAGIRGAKLAGQAINASKESGLLSNAHKLNPYAFKPNPKAYYRTLGKEGIDDAFNSGVIRPKQTSNIYSPELGKRVDVNVPEFPEGSYFNKSGLYSNNKIYNPDYIAEVVGKDNLFTYPERIVFNENIRVAPNNIPIEEANFYKKDWLKGYKEVPKPKENFKSEIDWGKWNKEIPENRALMQEYNAIDYKNNPLSDKEKEMYQWLGEQMRFDKLPETTNKQSIEVLNNFKQRIRTPEGQKRLKELGITEEQLLQDLKIVEDPNTYGYYRGAKNTIAMNPNHPLPKKVVRHEIEHGVQNALRQSKINKAIDGTVDNKKKALETNTTEIDDILSGLTLRREGTPNKVWSKPNINEPVDINDYKALINNKQNATDYFLTGSEGAEKSAFLGEVQQYMMDTGKIPKDSYTKITPEMVKETMIDAMFDEAGGGKYLRLFNIIKADSKNYEMISKALNKMLSISPLIGAGAYMQNKEYKNGGAIGNNGMFDMTNPNIYKSIIGAGTAGYLTKDEWMPKMQDGGEVLASNSFENNINIKPEYVGFLNEAQMMQQNRDKYWNEEQSNSKLLSAKEKLMNEQNKYNQQSEFLKEFGINNKLYGK